MLYGVARVLEYAVRVYISRRLGCVCTLQARYTAYTPGWIKKYAHLLSYCSRSSLYTYR
jgi:hypothetical protein